MECVRVSVMLLCAVVFGVAGWGGWTVAAVMEVRGLTVGRPWEAGLGGPVSSTVVFVRMVFQRLTRCN